MLMNCAYMCVWMFPWVSSVILGQHTKVLDIPRSLPFELLKPGKFLFLQVVRSPDMSFLFILPHNSSVPEPGECRAAYVVYMWIVSHPCWNFLCGATEHFWHQCLCLNQEDRHVCTPNVRLSILFECLSHAITYTLIAPTNKSVALMSM